MARSKAFDRDVALASAIQTFARFGFEGTSTDVLGKHMGVGRQSLYDTFGDKRRLYKEALQRYCFDSVTTIAVSLQDEGASVAAIEATLLRFAERILQEDDGGCLGIGAVCEFGRRDPEVAAIGDAAGASLHRLFEAAVRRARERGETSPEVDSHEAARFLMSVLSGMKIAARGGADKAALASIARTAMRCLG